MCVIKHFKTHLPFIISVLFLFAASANAQTLKLEEAIDVGMANYGIIKAKEHYKDAAEETVKEIKRGYLPNFNLAAQQTYGTINGQNGPQYGSGGLGVSSSGLPLEEQNWNAAFGALYLANVNWDFFTFGKTKSQIKTAKAEALQSEKDVAQEQFKHKIKIASSYLNLLASHRLLASEKRNLQRALVVHKNAAAQVKNGLLPGVDSTLASAEVSRAKIALNQLKQKLKNQNNELANYMGVAATDFVIDTTLISKIPLSNRLENSKLDSLNPILSFYKSRLTVGENQLQYYKKSYLPTFSLFGVYQTRGSGFDSAYNTNQDLYTSNYWDGVEPTRDNYILGIGLRWNLTDISRNSKKVSAQKLKNKGLKEEYKAISNALSTQLDAANTSLQIALENYKEAPIQVQAAQQAYKQRLTLYNNGLTDLVDVTQALYTLNRAETDQDVINTNVWQALLLKAASAGDFNLFINEIK
ncbi:TolC family protein [Cellulophaga lytica]|uniref:TolC family protein n=1 Tax=Cellulophaga lytica TaxID=979 RepID=UPI00068D51EC|nr:TolC family protein [Cellulophaga lytica]